MMTAPMGPVIMSCEQTLQEEKATDKKLTALAEGKVNALAAAS